MDNNKIKYVLKNKIKINKNIEYEVDKKLIDTSKHTKLV